MSPTPDDKAPIAINSIPEWLNKEFFQKALIKKHKSSLIKISDFSIVSISGNGENYCSNMFKIELKFELSGKNCVANLVIKTEPSDEMISEWELFPKEKEMYESVIPAFEKLFRDVGEDVQFAPNCIETGSEPIEYLLMEDLTKQNFRCEDRRAGLDMIHTKAILEKLAKFHAASAVHYENIGPYSEIFKDGMFSDKSPEIMNEMMTKELGYLAKFAETWPENGKKYAKIIDSWKSVLYDVAVKAAKPSPNGFNVLCHGDLWTNNFMYSHDDQNNIENLLMVDFQICAWTSPAIDLLFLLVESPELELKVKEFDTFVHYYHTHLVANLKKLNYTKKAPTLINLQIEMLQRASTSVYITTSHMAVVLLDPNSENNIENMMKEDEAGMNIKKNMYTSARYVAHMMELLPFFEKKGILDNILSE